MLDGNHIVITGAARGIGRAIAEACLEAGGRVGVNYFQSKSAALELAKKYPQRVQLLPFDVRDPLAVEAAVKRFQKASGRIDGWVNNAGVVCMRLLLAQKPETLREQVEVNVLGALYCARAVLPVMMRQKQGSLVNISSVSAVKPVSGQAAYAATKGAIEALTRALAVEYASRGIRVNCLRLGAVQAGMFESAKEDVKRKILDHTPLGRACSPEEVARAVVLLLSEQTSFITGAIQTMDGGYSLG